MLKFGILVLACYRLSILLIDDDGPFDLLSRFRDRIGVEYDEYGNRTATHEIAKLFNCVYCLSLWLGLALARLDILEGLAISGATIVLWRLTHD